MTSELSISAGGLGKCDYYERACEVTAQHAALPPAPARQGRGTERRTATHLGDASASGYCMATALVPAFIRSDNGTGSPANGTRVECSTRNEAHPPPLLLRPALVREVAEVLLDERAVFLGILLRLTLLDRGTLARREIGEDGLAACVRGA